MGQAGGKGERGSLFIAVWLTGTSEDVLSMGVIVLLFASLFALQLANECCRAHKSSNRK